MKKIKPITIIITRETLFQLVKDISHKLLLEEIEKNCSEKSYDNVISLFSKDYKEEIFFEIVD